MKKLVSSTKKRTFMINGVEIRTVNGGTAARNAYNRKFPDNKLKHCTDAWQFKEVR